ncbi:MAG: hypothetical protein APF84_14155 [Gracilibacter sp. BRH_c7a]|nr:MAG: hypothetical protein APF84_14155 [Gracilibacter sp. BRH_c7a]
MNNLLFSGYSHSYLPVKSNPLKAITPINNNCYPLSSPIFYPYRRVYTPYPLYSSNYYPVNYINNPYATNTQDNNYWRVNLLLIAILILTSLDLIFVRPLKKNN